MIKQLTCNRCRQTVLKLQVLSGQHHPLQCAMCGDGLSDVLAPAPAPMPAAAPEPTQNGLSPEILRAIEVVAAQHNRVFGSTTSTKSKVRQRHDDRQSHTM